MIDALLVVFEMSKHCSICTHVERKKIESLLIRDVTYREISGKYPVTKSALDRHKSSHLRKKLIKAREAKEMEEGGNLLEQIRDLQKKALDILSKAESEKDYRACLGAIREARGCLELLCRLSGELNERPQINILQMLEGLNSLSDTQLKALAQESIPE